MSWLSRVRNSLPFIQKRETPDNLWVKCPRCNEMLFVKDYEANLSVCPHCNHHGRIGADARLAQIMDPGFKLLALPQVQQDPLKFRDQKRYSDRLKQARAKTGHEDAFLVADGKIEKKPAVVGVQDFSFMGGSMGMAVGTAFCAGAERALSKKCPYIVFTAAGGARMQEALISLMQMAKTSAVIERLKMQGTPYISVMTDPVYGGVSASLALLGDINAAEPGARAGFAGPNIIEQTIRQKLPKGFQRSEFLLEHGAIDMIIHRRDMRDKVAALLAKFTRRAAV